MDESKRQQNTHKGQGTTMRHILGQAILCHRASVPLSEGLTISKKKLPVFNMLVPTSCWGWVVAGRPANKHMDSSACLFPPLCPFMTTEKTLNTGRSCLQLQTISGDLKYNSKCKESAINFQRYFCLLPVLYMAFSAPCPTEPQGLAENICFLSLVKSISIFSPCLLNLDKYPCLFN